MRDPDYNVTSERLLLNATVNNISQLVEATVYGKRGHNLHHAHLCRERQRHCRFEPVVAQGAGPGGGAGGAGGGAGGRPSQPSRVCRG